MASLYDKMDLQMFAEMPGDSDSPVMQALTQAGFEAVDDPSVPVMGDPSEPQTNAGQTLPVSNQGTNVPPVAAEPGATNVQQTGDDSPSLERAVLLLTDILAKQQQPALPTQPSLPPEPEYPTVETPEWLQSQEAWQNYYLEDEAKAQADLMDYRFRKMEADNEAARLKRDYEQQVQTTQKRHELAQAFMGQMQKLGRSEYDRLAPEATKLLSEDYSYLVSKLGAQEALTVAFEIAKVRAGQTQAPPAQQQTPQQQQQKPTGTQLTDEQNKQAIAAYLKSLSRTTNRPAAFILGQDGQSPAAIPKGIGGAKDARRALMSALGMPQPK